MSLKLVGQLGEPLRCSFTDQRALVLEHLLYVEDRVLASNVAQRLHRIETKRVVLCAQRDIKNPRRLLRADVREGSNRGAAEFLNQDPEWSAEASALRGCRHAHRAHEWPPREPRHPRNRARRPPTPNRHRVPRSLRSQRSRVRSYVTHSRVCNSSPPSPAPRRVTRRCATDAIPGWSTRLRLRYESRGCLGSLLARGAGRQPIATTHEHHSRGQHTC